MKQQRIRKSTSLVFKTLPSQPIVFNPCQFQVGESRISRLPERTLPRRNSVATLCRTEKPTPVKQPKELEIALLKKVNEKLAKENAELKNQLELYKKMSRSNSSRGKTSYLSEQSSKAELNLKNIVVEKINRTKCSSRLASDNQTGLYSSKQVSYNNQFESINQMDENFIKRAIRPSLVQYQQQLKKFFNDFEQAFIKLKYLFDAVPKQQQLSNPSAFSQCQSLLDSINEICCVKAQKEKVAKNPSLAEKGKSRPKVQRQPTREKFLAQDKEDILELLSPEQVVERFEKYIEKVRKSEKIMKRLKASIVVGKFTKKLSEV